MIAVFECQMKSSGLFDDFDSSKQTFFAQFEFNKVKFRCATALELFSSAPERFSKSNRGFDEFSTKFLLIVQRTVHNNFHFLYITSFHSTFFIVTALLRLQIPWTQTMTLNIIPEMTLELLRNALLVELMDAVLPTSERLN